MIIRICDNCKVELLKKEYDGGYWNDLVCYLNFSHLCSKCKSKAKKLNKDFKKDLKKLSDEYKEKLKK